MTDRLSLIKILSSIPQEQLSQVIFTLNPPSGIMPSNGASQGQQASALLHWAESPFGCGLERVQEVLDTIIKSPVNHNEQYILILSGTIDASSKNKAEAIVAHLRELIKDASLTLHRIESGSIKLFLEGSSDGFEILRNLYESGQLTEILGLPIEKIELLARNQHSSQTQVHPTMSNTTTQNESNQISPSLNISNNTDSTELVSQQEVINPEILAKIDDKYLEYQGYTCRDYETEGQSLQSFIPQLGDVFVPLELSNSFIPDHRGDHQPMPPGYHHSPDIINRVNKSTVINIWDLLKNSPKIAAFRHLVILALGGYGKTTLLRHITYIYTQKKQRRGVPDLLPVLVKLRDWQEKIAEDHPDLPTFIEQFHIPSLPPKNKTLSLPPNWALNHLEHGKMLILLDGFDEVRPEWREPVSKWIATQIENYRASCFILTSRPAGYKDFPDENKRFTGRLFIKNFNPKQQEEFIRRWYLCQESYARGGKRTKHVKTIAGDHASNLVQQLLEREELAALAKNPLMLNMIATLHRAYSGENLPQRRAELYRDIVQLQLWDRPRIKRIEMLLELSKSKQVLQGLALSMVKQNAPEMEYQNIINIITSHLKRVDDSISPIEFIQQIEEVSELLVKKDDRYEFAHLSFQGYLAAAEIERTKRENLLLQHYSESWWKETILLYVAQLRNPSNFIRSLLSLNNQMATDLAYECLKETPRQIDPDVKDPDVRAELEQVSSRVQNARYQRLEELLKNQQWKDADYETYRLMIETVGKTEDQWFDREDLEDFPCEDLRIINQLWFDNSNGKFAFSVQAEIYRSLGGTKEYNSEIWEEFSDRVGWRKGDKWLNYSDLDFHTIKLDAPNGNLPRVWLGWFCVWWAASFLAFRLVDCNISPPLQISQK